MHHWHLKMADSVQQPTADTNTLLNEIFEMITDMEIKRINVSCAQQSLQSLLQSLPKLSPEVGAGHLQNFRTTLLIKYRAEAGLAADEPDGSTASILLRPRRLRRTHMVATTISPTVLVPIPEMSSKAMRQLQPVILRCDRRH